LELKDSDTELRTRIAAQLNLLRTARSEIEEALECVPDDEGLKKNLEVLGQNIAALDDQQKMMELLKGFGGIS